MSRVQSFTLMVALPKSKPATSSVGGAALKLLNSTPAERRREDSR
jgi:hypothetical protein